MPVPSRPDGHAAYTNLFDLYTVYPFLYITSSKIDLLVNLWGSSSPAANLIRPHDEK